MSDLNTRYVTDLGTVHVRHDGDRLFLGVSQKRNSRRKPTCEVELTPMQALTLAEEFQSWLIDREIHSKEADADGVRLKW